MGPFITADGLTHVYALDDGEPVLALNDVNLTIQRGEFVALIGANGSGKSTLARHFNALLTPTAGNVVVDGLSTRDPENHWAVRRRVGMVFQNPENQLVASTVEEDVAFGPENWSLPRAEIRKRVDDALRTVGLEEAAATPPQMLSGGQKQLVAIAGALATRPDCLVLDEPTSMLDPRGRTRILETIRDLNSERGLTIVLITQSMSEAASAQRIVVMDQGEIAMDGPPDGVFEDDQFLLSLGLTVPVAAKIARVLQQEGLPLQTAPLTIPALVDALRRCCPRVGTAC